MRKTLSKHDPCPKCRKRGQRHEVHDVTIIDGRPYIEKDPIEVRCEACGHIEHRQKGW